jgi:hypothetical protein
MAHRKLQKAVVGILAAGVAAILIAGFLCRDRIREEWYLQQFARGDGYTRLRAAQELGKIRSERAIRFVEESMKGQDKEFWMNILTLISDFSPEVPQDPIASPVGSLFGPPIPAVVSAVDLKKNLAVLNVDSERKVRLGYEFTVYRKDKFIAKVKVIKVIDDLAGVRILYMNEGESVQIGDEANTQI